MAYTYSKIATITVPSSGASNLDFFAIPQNYTDLMIFTSIRGTTGSSYNVSLQFNNDTGTSYTIKRLLNAASDGYTTTKIYGPQMNDSQANTFNNGSIYIPNYSGIGQKSVSIDAASEINSASGYALVATAGLWTGASPITSIKLICEASGNFGQYSTFYLYGIKAEV